MESYLVYSIYLMHGEGGISYVDTFSSYVNARWQAIIELGRTDYYESALIYEERIGPKGRKVQGLVNTVKL